MNEIVFSEHVMWERSKDVMDYELNVFGKPPTRWKLGRGIVDSVDGNIEGEFAEQIDWPYAK